MYEANKDKTKTRSGNLKIRYINFIKSGCNHLPFEENKITAHWIFRFGTSGGGRVFEVWTDMSFLRGSLRPVISVEIGQDLEPQKH
jgi:hypothetical protein